MKNIKKYVGPILLGVGVMIIIDEVLKDSGGLTRWLVLGLIFVGLFFIFEDYNEQNNKKIIELDKKIDNVQEFEQELTLVAGSNTDRVSKNISEYLALKNKHNFENVVMMVLPIEKESKIDKIALEQRRKEEISALIKKESSDYTPSFPIKKSEQ